MQLVVGRITRPHGVRGEVSVEVRTDEPDRRFAVGRVLATDPVAAGPLTVESARWHSGRLLIQFAGVADRNQAEDLRGIWLTLDSAEAGPTGDPDEFHDHELIGLAVVTTSGEPVGRVTDVRHFGQDLLVIEPQPTGAVKPQPASLWGPGRPGRDRYPRGRRPVAPPWRPAGWPGARRTTSCWSRSWPRSCPRSTWPRAGSSSIPRQGCSSWRPGNPVRPVRQTPVRQTPRTPDTRIARHRAADTRTPGTRADARPAARHPHARHPSGTNRPGSNRSGSSWPSANPSSRKLR